MKRTLGWVAETLGLQRPADADREITGWSIDTRTLAPGDLFFALSGEKQDGHLYVEDALRKGAAAAIVERAVSAGPELLVKDGLIALQTLARQARSEWPGEVIGVTGSAGKTTTKEIIATLLGAAKSAGNLNNHLGVPLSILRLPEDASRAVIEMGMNHAGEIRALAEIARPRIGVVTNVGWAHIDTFASQEGIAAAKRELIEALPASGVAVLNADDPHVATFAHPHRITYGIDSAADVRAEDVRFSLDGATFRVGPVEFSTALAGRHNVGNILAGIAVARSYGIAADTLVERVRSLVPAKMRGERFETRGILVYNDCYNSNPDAARAMLDVLRDTPARARIAVLGEMLELGHWAETLHRDVGTYAARCGVTVLVGIRGAACHMLDAAKRAGLSADAAFFFDEPAPAGRLVRKLAQPGDAILFKGSRGVRVEEALAEFAGAAEGAR